MRKILSIIFICISHAHAGNMWPKTPQASDLSQELYDAKFLRAQALMQYTRNKRRAENLKERSLLNNREDIISVLQVCGCVTESADQFLYFSQCVLDMEPSQVNQRVRDEAIIAFNTATSVEIAIATSVLQLRNPAPNTATP